MVQWTPDPTFYPSPRLAAKAPAETLAYVAALRPGAQGAGLARRGRCRSEVQELLEDRGQARPDPPGRRVAPFRLERLQLLPLPERAAPACRAALSHCAGPQILARLRHRHQA